MKRDKITISENMVIVTGGTIWMTETEIVELFGKKESAKKKAMLFYQETPVQNGFIQSNTVSYYFDGEKVRGVIIGQITSN